MNRKYPPTRFAFLFGAPGQKGPDFLTGVARDLVNVKRFLLSPNGGAWREDEIIVRNNITYDEAIMLRQNYNADFVLVYFSGHGFCDWEGKRFLYLQDMNIAAGELFEYRSTWQLNIADSCGNFASASIGVLDTEHWEYFDGISIARAKFDDAILSSVPGFQVIFPSQPGFATGDSINGGNFTLALLRSAKKKRTTFHSAITMKRILDDIPRHELNNNIPVTYYMNTLSLPFAVSIPPEDHIERAPSRIQPPQQKANWGGLALLAIGLYVVGSALRNSPDV